jgi:hypothetical protein
MDLPTHDIKKAYIMPRHALQIRGRAQETTEKANQGDVRCVPEDREPTSYSSRLYKAGDFIAAVSA